MPHTTEGILLPLLLANSCRSGTKLVPTSDAKPLTSSTTEGILLPLPPVNLGSSGTKLVPTAEAKPLTPNT